MARTEDKITNPYFEITDRSMTVTLDRVIEREPLNPIDWSELGYRWRRPGTVQARSGHPLMSRIREMGRTGSWTATTLHVLRELGKSKVVVELLRQDDDHQR